MPHLIIPARLNSRRIPRKNARTFCGRSLLEIAIQKSLDSKVFKTVVVNTPDEELAKVAEQMGVSVYRRSSDLDLPSTTNDDFLKDYVKSLHLKPNWLFMLNTTSPMLSVQTIVRFVEYVWHNTDYSTVLSVVPEKAPFVLNGHPVNFCYDHHTPSEFLPPLKKVVWGVSAWKTSNFCTEQCGVYAGSVGYFDIPQNEAIDIDTEDDWKIAELVYEKTYGIYRPWTGLFADYGGE